MAGTILAIQHYSVNDGPGIRTLVFLKGCPLRCVWCCNPESQQTWPQLRHISFRCKTCLACVNSCPTSSISFSDNLIHLNFKNCDQCHAKVCVETCNYDAMAISGKEMTADELVEIIKLDIPFYRNSGGGVTFSGGEPLMQAAFLLAVLQKCKELGIHTTVETCGFGERKAIQSIMPFTDLFLFDLKIINQEQHLIYTGKSVSPILDNLAFLAAEKAEIQIRFPLIPGITDNIENLENIIEIMNINSLKRISLVPYHTLGTEKYAEHGMIYQLDGIGHYNQDQISAFCDFFTKSGLLCEVI